MVQLFTTYMNTTIVDSLRYFTSMVLRVRIKVFCLAHGVEHFTAPSPKEHHNSYSTDY